MPLWKYTFDTDNVPPTSGSFHGLNPNLSGGNPTLGAVPGISITSERTRSGNRAMRSYVHRDLTNNKYRAQATVSRDWIPMDYNRGANTQDYWFGVSVYVPSPYPKVIDKSFQMFFEIHTSPVDNVWTGYCGSPQPLSLNLNPASETGGYIRVIASGGGSSCKNPDGTCPNAPYTITNAEAIAYQTDKWQDYVVHIKLTDDSAGFLEIWKDGQKFVDYSGPTYRPCLGAPYPALGMYLGWQDTADINNREPVKDRLIYLDELKIAWGADGSYESVSPSSTPIAPLPDPDPIVREVFETKPSLPTNRVIGANFDAMMQGSTEVGGESITYSDFAATNTTNAIRPVVSAESYPQMYSVVGEDVAWKVGGNAIGEWRKHTVDVPVQAYVTPKVRAASRFGVAISDSPFLRVKIGGATVAEFLSPAASGSWDIWETIEAAPVTLPAGLNQELTFEILQTGADYLWVEFTPATPPGPEPEPPDPEPEPEPVRPVGVSRKRKTRSMVSDPFGV
jgi:hypothetical protein